MISTKSDSYKNVLKNLIYLSIPTIIEEILSTLLQYVDTAMVGQLGETATASVSVTTTVSWLIHCVPSAVGVAALSLIAQAYGRNDKDEIRRISGQLTMLVIVFGIVVGGASVLLSPFIPKWMGAEQNIHRQASIYFAIVSSSMIFRCAGWIFGSAIRATKDTKTPMAINMAANVLNVILNYLLIYTAGLGVTGAAIATAISFSLAGIAMFIAFRRNKILCGEFSHTTANSNTISDMEETYFNNDILDNYNDFNNSRKDIIYENNEIEEKIIDNNSNNIFNNKYNNKITYKTNKIEDNIINNNKNNNKNNKKGFLSKIFSKNENDILCKPDIQILKKFADIALPVMGTNVTSCAGYVVFASLVTGMGNTIFAAHSIAVNAETIFYIPGYGLRTATSTLVGISIGEKNQSHFDRVSKLSIVTTVLMMCVTGMILYFTAFPLMSFFTSSERVAVIGSEMLRLVAFSEPFFGLMIVTEGIFYGMGRTKYPFVVETLSMWGIRILSTFIVVRILNLGLREVWYCMILDNICKALLLFVPFLSKKRRQIA